MKNLAKLLCATLLFTSAVTVADCGVNGCSTNSTSACGDCCDGCCYSPRSIYVPRSAGLNLARDMYRNFTYFDRCECGDDCCFYADLNLALEGGKSFKDKRIAKSLFGNSYMNFVGSKADVTTRPADAILADNFGLAPDTNAKLYFSPKIKTFTANVQLFLGLDEWAEGLYFKLNLPISHADWDLNMGCSDCCDSNDCCSTNGTCTTTCSTAKPGEAKFAAGVMDSYFKADGATLNPVDPATSFCQALGGDFLFGDMQTAWKYGRFGTCDDSETKIANLTVDLGYNFWMCEDYHMGIFLRAGAPTGTNIDACYARSIFNPMVGEDHWFLGAGISAHSELWRSCDEDATFNVFFEGYITHMFERDQVRTFDFKNGALSRYSLLKEFAKAAGATEYTYQGSMINAVNWTTRCAEVEVDVMGEAAIDFVYQNCNWDAGIGYNIYGRSSEDICIKGFADSSVANKKYGIKGCTPIEAPIWSIKDDGGLKLNARTGVQAVNATESNAKVYGATFCGTVDNAQDFKYPAVIAAGSHIAINQIRTDASKIAADTVYTDTTIAQESASSAVTGYAGNVFTFAANAIEPKLLTDSDLDSCSAANPSYISHKIFAHVDYTWSDCDWAPYLGLGAEVEFGSSDDCNVLNQWGIWLKGGLTY